MNEQWIDRLTSIPNNIHSYIKSIQHSINQLLTIEQVDDKCTGYNQFDLSLDVLPFRCTDSWLNFDRYDLIIDSWLDLMIDMIWLLIERTCDDVNKWFRTNEQLNEQDENQSINQFVAMVLTLFGSVISLSNLTFWQDQNQWFYLRPKQMFIMIVHVKVGHLVSRWSTRVKQKIWCDSMS